MWWMYYPSAAGGCQSPIDIVTEDTYVDPDQMHNGCCLYHLDVCYLSSSSHSSDQPKETNDEARTVVNTGNAVRISLTNSCSCKKLESIAAFCETQTPIKRLHNYLNVAKPVFFNGMVQDQGGGQTGMWTVARLIQSNTGNSDEVRREGGKWHRSKTQWQTTRQPPFCR